MAFNIIPIDLEKIYNFPANKELEPDLFELYKPIVIEDAHLNQSYGRVVSGTVDVRGKSYHVGWGSSPYEAGFKVSRIISEPHPDPVVNKWGDWFGVFKYHDKKLSAWVNGKMHTYRCSEDSGDEFAANYDWCTRTKLFNPMRSAIAFGKISVYQSRKDYDNDRQVAMKPGRAFKLMFPDLHDTVIIEWVDEYLDEFAPRQYALHTSKEAKDFVKAYTGDQVSTQNVSHSYTVKSLACSCMRYKFKDDHGPKNLPIHPVAAYASGDFNIIWTEDSNGLIGGRSVVCLVDPENITFGPIYGACQSAVDMMLQHMRDIGATEAKDGDWIGASLVAHEYGDEDEYIAPYLDIEPRNLEIRGEYLVIDGGGEIDANSYQGLLSENNNRCDICNSGIHEDEVYHSDHTGDMYCSDCYYETHFYCDYVQEDCHIDQSIRVHSTCSYGTDSNLAHHQALDDGDAIECTDGKVWDADEVCFCECEDAYIGPDNIDDYFNSDWDNNWYPNDQSCMTEDDDRVSKDELKENEEVDDCTWRQNELSVYVKTDNESNPKDDDDEVCTCEICKE